MIYSNLLQGQSIEKVSLVSMEECVRDLSGLQNVDLLLGNLFWAIFPSPGPEIELLVSSGALRQATLG
jgi:hypothetical protein